MKGVLFAMEQKLHTPEGVRDIYSRECEIKLTLQKKLNQVLHLYGYRDIQTPTFEYYDVFREEIGSTSTQELYKFFDREGNILALRPDITPSVGAINYMAGNPANTYELVVEQQGKTPALVFGSWQNWVVAFVTLAIVVALNHYGKGLFKLASILIGLLCGYVLALCFGMVDFSVLSSAGWFQIPKPMEFGMKFEISAIIPLAILFLVNSIQAMGDFSATTSGGMDRLPTDRELNGGIIGYGIGNIISAFFGCPPTATFSQNVGIVGTTKVISRRVFATSAGILLVAGLIPKFSALLRTIPQCVLGGAVVSVFASIAMTGIRLLVTEKLTARNATVAGLSIAIGMGVSLSGGCLDQMTQSIHSALNLSMNLENFQAIINNTFASSPVVLATIFAVILNLILPKEKTTEKETKLR